MELTDFIKKARWQTSKDGSHQYTVRVWNSNSEFDEAIRNIISTGIEGKFWKKTYLYSYQDDGYKYWTMGNPIDETIIINRTKWVEKGIK